MGTITYDFERTTRVEYLTLLICLIFALPALAKIYNFLELAFTYQIWWFIEEIQHMSGYQITVKLKLSVCFLDNSIWFYLEVYAKNPSSFYNTDGYYHLNHLYI
jgi:hypothetical protein